MDHKILAKVLVGKVDSNGADVRDRRIVIKVCRPFSIEVFTNDGVSEKIDHRKSKEVLRANKVSETKYKTREKISSGEKKRCFFEREICVDCARAQDFLARERKFLEFSLRKVR